MSEDRNVNEGSPEEARAAQVAGEPDERQPVAPPVPPPPAYQPPARSKIQFGRVIRSSAVHLAGAGLIGGLVGGGVVALTTHDDRGGRPSFSRNVSDQNGFGRQRTLPGQGQNDQQTQPGGGRQSFPGGGQSVPDDQTQQNGQTPEDGQTTTVIPG